MKIIEPGHIYRLDTKLGNVEDLIFFKDLSEGGNGHDGVLNQEVYRALIDRNIALFIQKPCGETMRIIKRLRACLRDAEVRAFGNTLDKAYGKSGLNVEELRVCQNGHIYQLPRPIQKQDCEPRPPLSGAENF